MDADELIVDKLIEQARKSHLCNCGAAETNEALDELGGLIWKMVELLKRVSTFTGLPDSIQDDISEVITQATGDALLSYDCKEVE